MVRLSPEEIDQQQVLLATHRRALAHLLRQAAHFSAGHLPAHIEGGIDEARREIAQIKALLRDAETSVADHVDDRPRPIAQSTGRSTTEQRNRQAMLKRVRTIWIEGLLDQSLANELRIALDLTEHPNAVAMPLNALVQELRRPPRPLLSGTPIITVFEQMDGALLILGAPGAGKTTLLLELARDLIARAEDDEGHPIPVVFNLSSWAEKRRPLNEWLIEELNTKYDVPRKVAQTWIDSDEVLPLLGGLDEVAAEVRGNCVAAINTYREEHGLVPLAVCSRVADYESLTVKLRLQGAVVAQALTQPQVDGYLERAGEKLAGVRAALCDDTVLGELLDTPLMLTIVALAYVGKSVEEVLVTGTLEERRSHLFGAYIVAMFKRRRKDTGYTAQQTTSWLSWLADKMVQRNQTIFYIERMQPDLLPQRQQRHYARHVRLLGGLIFGLAVGLTGGLIFGLAIGLASGLIFGLVGGLVSQRSEIVVVETLRWSWSRARSELIGRVGGRLAVVLAIGLAVVLAIGLVGGLIFGVVGGLVGGLAVGLVGGLGSSDLEVKATPNQGIRRSIRSALIFAVGGGLVFGLGGGLVGGLVGGLGGGLVGGLSGVVVVVLAGGLGGGLDYGGRAVIQHYTLRWLLYRNGSLPLRLVPFLDECADRILLRKVGGGYIFVHRLLLEYFASLHESAPPADKEAP